MGIETLSSIVTDHTPAQNLKQRTEKNYSRSALSGRAVNVGVDVNNYMPISIHEAIEVADNAVDEEVT